MVLKYEKIPSCTYNETLQFTFPINESTCERICNPYQPSMSIASRLQPRAYRPQLPIRCFITNLATSVPGLRSGKAAALLIIKLCIVAAAATFVCTRTCAHDLAFVLMALAQKSVATRFNWIRADSLPEQPRGLVKTIRVLAQDSSLEEPSWSERVCD
jgi:hypothetical protein